MRIGGAWNSKEQIIHMNCQELLAAWYATQAYVQVRTNLTILLWIDNRSAMAYINHMGGTHSSSLADLAIQFWNWALERGIFLVAKHIAGKENVSLLHFVLSLCCSFARHLKLFMSNLVMMTKK